MLGPLVFAFLLALPFSVGSATAAVPSIQTAPYSGASGAVGSLNFTHHCASSVFPVLPWIHPVNGTAGSSATGSARTCPAAANGSNQVTDGWGIWTVPLNLSGGSVTVVVHTLIRLNFSWNVSGGALCASASTACAIGTITYLEMWVSVTDLTVAKTRTGVTDYLGPLGYLVSRTCGSASCFGVFGSTAFGRLNTTLAQSAGLGLTGLIAGDSYQLKIYSEFDSFANAELTGSAALSARAEFQLQEHVTLAAIDLV